MADVSIDKRGVLTNRRYSIVCYSIPLNFFHSFDGFTATIHSMLIESAT